MSPEHPHMTTQQMMGVFLMLSVAFYTLFASSYKIAVRRNCNLQVVNVWIYVGSLATMAVYVLLKRQIVFNEAAFLMGIVSGVMVYFATLSFFYHMTRGQLSTSWTVISLSIAFPVLASILAWGEHPSPRQTVGMVLIVIALVLFGRHESSNGGLK